MITIALLRIMFLHVQLGPTPEAFDRESYAECLTERDLESDENDGECEEP